MESISEILSNEQFDEMLFKHVEMIEDFFKEVETDAYMPEIVVFDLDGSIQVFKIALDEDRAETVRHIGILAHRMELKPLAIIMVAEFWIREVPENHPISSRPISSYEDKQEVISVVGMTADKRMNGAMLWFDRNENNSIVIKDNKRVFSCLQQEKGGMSICGNLLPQFFIGYAQEYMSTRN